MQPDFHYGLLGLRAGDMTRVYVAKHPTDAHLFKGILEQEGIEAIVRGEALFGARGEAPLTFDTLPSVWVLDPEDAERAGCLALEYERGAAPGGPRDTWRCGGCGEILEEQFGACWNCGRARGA